MTVDHQTDMTEMFAGHDCLRHEFAQLPRTGTRSARRWSVAMC